MYSPSAKHAPQSELPSTFIFIFIFNISVGSEEGEDGESTSPPHNGSLYACNTFLVTSVMNHAVIK
jgi:hypothetical protein